MFDFLRNIGPAEIIIIAVILIIFFGSRKITELGKNAGEATREIKKIKKEFTGAAEDVKKDIDEIKEVEK
jgi:TatA/E family protein of Tat protein translocase